MVAIFVISGTIQDGEQHVQVVDLPKLSDVLFLLQIWLNSGVISAVFVTC